MAEEFEKNIEDGYEDICFICRRPESKAGKMLQLPNRITVCTDCMQKTMESISNVDYQSILNDSSFINSFLKSSYEK